MKNSILRHVECTSAAIQALALFTKLYPDHRKVEVENCISKAANFLERAQRRDGSWLVLNPMEKLPNSISI